MLYSHPMLRYISHEASSVVFVDGRCVVSFTTVPDYRSIEALVEVAEQAIFTTNQQRLERGLEPVELQARAF